MRLYEYQGKQLFTRYGISVPKGAVVSNSSEARGLIGEIPFPWMAKAQILQGGRGKAGGILSILNVEKIDTVISSLVGSSLKGEKVTCCLIEEKKQVQNEFYLGLIVDDRHGQPVAVASAQGGVEIEELAAQHPEQVVRYLIDPLKGLRRYEAIEILHQAGFGGALLVEAADMLFNLYRVFTEMDAQLVEINPVIYDTEGRLAAGDAKIIINDDALFRHPELQQVVAPTDGVEETLVLVGRRKGFNYVELDGEVALMTLGAGFGMMVSDTFSLYGCRPANFIDTFGGAGPDVVKDMMEAVLSKADRDPKVKVIFIAWWIGATSLKNVIGGLVEALQVHPSRVPVLASITAVGAATLDMSMEEGVGLLQENGVVFYDYLRDGIEAAVHLVRGDKEWAS